MSSVCAITTCKDASRVLCYVCHQSLCRKHFDEHDHSLNLELNCLNDKIKDFDDRLEEMNNEQLIENCFEKLDKWRDESYKTIDQLYDHKCREIRERFKENIDRQEEKVNQLNFKISQLLEEEDIEQTNVNSLKVDVENVEDEIIKMEESSFEIEVHPLTIEKNLIRIEQINLNEFNLRHPYETIECSNHLSKALASNEQYLLIYRMKNLCLINREFKLVKQILWTYGRIWDMSWSSTLNRFIIMAHYDLYLIDTNTMSIQRIQTILRENWWTCTCSDTSLFLSTYQNGSSIMEYRLQPSIELIKEWTSPLTCTKDEHIKHIIYNNQTLALTIFNTKSYSKRIELRSIRKLDYIWSLQLDIQGQCHNTLRSCLIKNNQWLVADFHNQRLFHITNEGKLKRVYTYNTSPWYLNLFSSSILVISTENSINFHKL